MKFSFVTLSIAALCLFQQIHAAPTRLTRRGDDGGHGVIGNGVGSNTQLLNDNHVLNVLSKTDSHDNGDGGHDHDGGKGVIGNGILSNDKILSGNHLLNIGSHTESKRDDGKGVIGNGVLSGDKILDKNHVLNILSHTESKRDGGEGVIGNGVLSGDTILDKNHVLNILSHTDSKRDGGEGVIGNGVLSGDKILGENHLLNIGSHTESKRGDGKGVIGNGVLSGDKILDKNHVLNILSHTESKRDGGAGVIGNGVLSGDKILDKNHVLNVLSHTESKRSAMRRDNALLSKLLNDSTLGDLVGGTDASCDGTTLDEGAKNRLKDLVKQLLVKDDGLKPVLGDLFDTTVGLLGALEVEDVLDLAHVVTRDNIDSKLETVIGLLHKLLDSANEDDHEQVTEVVKIVTELIKSALCTAT